MGSFPVDIDLRIDPKSALKAYQEFTSKAKALMADVAAGVEGAEKKLQQAHENFARSVISGSTRAGRAIESSIRSLERQAEVAGKTRSEQLLVRQEKWIKMLGDDEKAVQRVTAAFQQLIKVEQEEERKRASGGTGVGSLLFRGARDIFEGRSAYGIMDIGRAGMQAFGGGAGAGLGAAGAGGAEAAAGIGSATIAVGALGAAMIGLEAAGFRAAKSLGEYGTEIRDVEVRTGLSAREVTQFSFAAKAVGQDVSITERLMRGLSQAADDNSTEGEKARQTFERLHVTLKDNITGAMKPTSQMLTEIAEALARLPAGVERDAAAMAMFKRVGVEAVPFMTELAENLRVAREHGWGPSEEEVTRLRGYQRTMTELETSLGELKRMTLEPIAATFIFTIKTSGTMTAPLSLLSQYLFGGRRTPTDIEMEETQGYGYGPESAMSRSRNRMEQDAIKHNNELVTLARAGVDENKKLTVAEKELQTLQAGLQKDVMPSVNKDLIDRIELKKQEIKGIKEGIEAERRAKTERETIVKDIARMHEEARDLTHRGELPAEAELRKFKEARAAYAAEALPERAREAYVEREGAAAAKVLRPLIDLQRQEQADKFARQMLETRQAIEREQFRAGLGGIQPVDIRELGTGGVTRADVESDINARYEQRLDIAKQLRAEEEKLIDKRTADDAAERAQKERDLVKVAGDERTAQIVAEMERRQEMYRLAKQERDEERKHREEMSKIQLADQEESIKHDADLARKRAELRFRGDNPAAGIAESYRIAVVEAQQLYELEMTRIANNESGGKAEEDRARAIHKLHREDEAAREEAQFKLAQMQQQQLDKLKGTIEPLYETLFTHPTKFGQQLRQTVTEAALHPIVSGLSEMTARAFYPMIYGATGTGGIAGAFGHMFGGGRLNDVKLTAEGSVPVHVTGVSGAGGGGGGGLFPWFPGAPGGTAGFAGPVNLGGGGFGAIAGAALPRMLAGFGIGGAAAALEGLPFGGRPFGQDLASQTLGAILGAGGGTGAMAAPAGLPVGRPYGQDLATLTLGAILGQQGQGQGSLQKSISSFFGKYIGGSPYGKGGLGTIEGTFGGYGGAFGGSTAQAIKALSTGPFAGTPAGPAAGSIGTMLAMTGIFGQQRGRLGGVAEATAGGFLAAGPIGAAVGAGIGFGEMLAGVEAPRYEAKRVAKQLYNISINNSTADQIVNIANQSYAGHVSLAVRSPEVRRMLGLYAAGTGQAGSYSAQLTQAHGASLVEAGGSLYQQATYQYGQAYAYSSNLPVYGGVNTHPLGAPGGGMSLSLNIAGQDAAKFLQGNVVSPEVVQTQYASAMSSSSGRVPQALMMTSPGMIAS